MVFENAWEWQLLAYLKRFLSCFDPCHPVSIFSLWYRSLIPPYFPLDFVVVVVVFVLLTNTQWSTPSQLVSRFTASLLYLIRTPEDFFRLFCCWYHSFFTVSSEPRSPRFPTLALIIFFLTGNQTAEASAEAPQPLLTPGFHFENDYLNSMVRRGCT